MNVIIDSTINHTPDSTAPFSDGNLDIITTGSLALNADVGAGDAVNISNSGAGGINIAGNVFSDNDGDDSGSVNVSNSNSAALTTISGDLNGFGSGGVNVTTNGNLDITGDLFAFSAGATSVNLTNTGLGKTTTIDNGAIFADLDVNVTVVGPLDIDSWIWPDRDANMTNNSLAAGNTTTIAGLLWAGNDIRIYNNGGISSNLDVMADVLAIGYADGYSFIDIYSGGNGHLSNITNGSAGGDMDVYFAGLQASLRGAIDINDALYYGAPYATTKFHTSASIMAPFMTLEVLNLRGVQDDGSAYTDVLQKPGVQIFGDFIDVIAYGSVNSPIAGNTNWLLNDLGMAPVTAGFPVQLDISAIGGGFQAINLSVDGDVGLTSGMTTTPFSVVGLTGSVLLPPPLIANGGSQLIVQATGDMDVWGTAGPFFPLTPFAFQFPGGVVLKAGGYLSQNAPIYNAWTTVAQPWQGIFLESDTIIAGGFQATNGNSWVNYSSAPVTGPSTVYQITNPARGCSDS